MKLEEEIKQSKFKNEFQKAGINILFTAAWMNKANADTLKPYNISIQQFNILRILRGMHPEPASVKLLTERMIDKMSNASRLVEKLKCKGFVDRLACSMDRRQVDIHITKAGLKLLDETSQELDNMLANRLNAMSEEEAILLNQLLDKLRG